MGELVGNYSSNLSQASKDNYYLPHLHVKSKKAGLLETEQNGGCEERAGKGGEAFMCR